MFEQQKDISARAGIHPKHMSQAGHQYPRKSMVSATRRAAFSMIADMQSIIQETDDTATANYFQASISLIKDKL
jgi:hypothetical protein